MKAGALHVYILVFCVYIFSYLREKMLEQRVASHQSLLLPHAFHETIMSNVTRVRIPSGKYSGGIILAYGAVTFGYVPPR